MTTLAYDPSSALGGLDPSTFYGNPYGSSGISSIPSEWQNLFKNAVNNVLPASTNNGGASQPAQAAQGNANNSNGTTTGSGSSSSNQQNQQPAPYDYGAPDYSGYLMGPTAQDLYNFGLGTSYAPFGYGGGYGPYQSPSQLSTIGQEAAAMAGAQGQIGAAQAGAQGQIGAAQAAAQGNIGVAQLGLQGTENTNATNQNIAGIGQSTQLGLGQLGLQGQLGTAQLGLQGTEAQANAALQAAIAQSLASQNVAGTQAQAQEAVANTQNAPALAKLDLAKQLFGLGGTSGTGTPASGGILGSTPLGSGIAQTGGISSISSPAVPNFTPLDDIARQRVLGQQDAQINQGYDTQNNNLNQDLASRGFSNAGPGTEGLLAQNEQRRLGDLTNAGLNTQLNFDQYNAQNALPYGQLGLQNYNAALDRALQAQLANAGFVSSFLS